MKLLAILLLTGAVGTTVFFAALGRLTGTQGKADPAVLEGGNAFALDLYAHLRQQEGNLFFSPYSVSSALAMTYAGAKGDTAAEMAKTLHFPADSDKLHTSYAALLSQLNGDGKDRGYQLDVANALWGQKGYPFLQPYLTLVRDRYRAGLSELDFGNSEEARKIINTWVEKKTHDKIKDLLPDGSINGLTRLVLTNAIYFKGDWATPFKKNATREDKFSTSASDSVKVPMMHQTNSFGYFDGGTFQALEMPYRGKELSMVVLLPNQVDGLAEFEKMLSQDNLKTWVGKLRPERVEVALPKFKMTNRFAMNKTLSEMGMPLAFDQDKADFSGMNGSKGLYISGVFHKAFVDVNEEGTEAAAATGVVVSLRATPAQKARRFHADHPFVFLIRDINTGSVLFLGRVSNPQ